MRAITPVACLLAFSLFFSAARGDNAQDGNQSPPSKPPAIPAAKPHRKEPATFAPFPFDKAGVPKGNLKMLLHVVTGSEKGLEVLEADPVMALVRTAKAPDSGWDLFSFCIDGKLVTEFSGIEARTRNDLLRRLKRPETYGETAPVFQFPHLFPEEATRLKVNPIAIELSDDGNHFLRLYFDEAFTNCFYSAGRGVDAGKWFALSPEMTERITAIVKAAAGHWVNLRNSQPHEPGAESR